MNGSPFSIRGVIEGFYGVYYTAPERDDLLRFMGNHGFNLYVYAPKNDRQHRLRWREPYPRFVMEQFGHSVRVAQAAGITFCYAIGVGLSICYAAEDDFRFITNKFRSFYALGVRAFSIALDDITPDFLHEEDRQRYASFAAAHADICNRLYTWLQALDAACTLSICPTDYAGKPPFSDYLQELGIALHPDIDIFYTGPDICSRVIDAATTAEFARAAQRQPIIWDNYPVNDGGMQTDMHIGPVRGREATLPGVVKGVVVNTMNQAEASKVALLTFADYFAAPHDYQPEASWLRALQAVAGPESGEALRLFAENSLRSCLEKTAAPHLKRLVHNVLMELDAGQRPSGSTAVSILNQYLDDLDEATYHLKYRMNNLALRNNLLPWIELLEHWLLAGRQALAILTAREGSAVAERPLRQLQQSYQAARTHHKKIGGAALKPLIERALLPMESHHLKAKNHFE